MVAELERRFQFPLLRLFSLGHAGRGYYATYDWKAADLTAAVATDDAEDQVPSHYDRHA